MSRKAPGNEIEQAGQRNHHGHRAHRHRHERNTVYPAGAGMRSTISSRWSSAGRTAPPTCGPNRMTHPSVPRRRTVWRTTFTTRSATRTWHWPRRSTKSPPTGTRHGPEPGSQSRQTSATAQPGIQYGGRPLTRCVVPVSLQQWFFWRVVHRDRRRLRRDVHSNQPDQNVTATSGSYTKTWHTDSSGYADVYLRGPGQGARSPSGSAMRPAPLARRTHGATTTPPVRSSAGATPRRRREALSAAARPAGTHAAG